MGFSIFFEQVNINHCEVNRFFYLGLLAYESCRFSVDEISTVSGLILTPIY